MLQLGQVCVQKMKAVVQGVLLDRQRITIAGMHTLMHRCQLSSYNIMYRFSLLQHASVLECGCELCVGKFITLNW